MLRQVKDGAKAKDAAKDAAKGADGAKDEKKKATTTLSNFFVSTQERSMVNSAMVNSAMVNSGEDCFEMSKKRKRMTDEEAEALADADMQALLKAQEQEQVPALLEPASLEPASLEDDVISFGVTRAECEGCQLLAKGLGGENQASHACLGF